MKYFDWKMSTDYFLSIHLSTLFYFCVFWSNLKIWKIKAGASSRLESNIIFFPLKLLELDITLIRGSKNWLEKDKQKLVFIVNQHGNGTQIETHHILRAPSQTELNLCEIPINLLNTRIFWQNNVEIKKCQPYIFPQNRANTREKIFTEFREIQVSSLWRLFKVTFITHLETQSLNSSVNTLQRWLSRRV